MADAIFLRTGDELSAMTNTPYDEEKILQKALSVFPSLIAGAATTGDSGQLMLIKPEMPVGGAAGNLGLSLDHLFVDDVGVPVLVEVKRSSDTRARREVVAQMLDYAANGVAYWSSQTIRGAVLQSATAAGFDEGAYLVQQLGTSLEPEAFWQRVDDNLRAGRVRLIFLADKLSAELVRIIEFLNEQMRDTEVLGIELPQYVSETGAIVYVPRLVGKTAVAVTTKGGGSKSWDRESMLEAAEAILEKDELHLLVDLLDDVVQRGGRYSWGTGETAGVTGWYQVAGKDTPVWNINIGAGKGKGRFYFVLAEYASRHLASGRVEAFAEAAMDIPPLKDKVAESQHNGWKGWAGATLSTAAAHRQEILSVVTTAVS